MASASDILESAFQFPRSDDDWVVTVLIGGLMILAYYVLSFVTSLVFITFPLLLVPLFLLYGYVVAAIRETLAGEDLPEWGDVGWGDVLVDGGKLWVVTIGYWLAVLVPFFALAFGSGFLDAAGSGTASSAAASTARLVGGLVLFAGILAVYYVLPAATVNFAREDSLTAAFDVGTITDVVLTADYLIGWLLALVVGVLWFVASLLVGVTVVGILLLPWVAFFFVVGIFHVFARAYADALDLDIPLSDVEPVD